MFNAPLHISELHPFSIQEVPTSLELLQNNNMWFVGVVLMFGVILIAFARLFEANYIKAIAGNYLTFSSSEKLEKNQVKLDSISSLLLLVNFLVSIWVCFVLFLNALFPLDTANLLLWSVISVGGIVLYQLFGLGFAAWVTGETQFIKEHIIQTIAGFQFAGIVFLILGIFWFLYPNFRVELFYSFAFVLIVLLSIRFIRGIISSLKLGVPWYYIILYFCTLEILPILVTYYYVARNFKV